MRRVTTRIFTVVKPLLIALLSVCWLYGIRASAAVLEPSLGAGPALLPFSAPVLSDFDSDHKPDQASLSWNGSVKTIHIHFGNSSWTSFSFDSGVSDPGRLVSEDINNDGYADLIWLSQSTPGTFAAWLGDGGGHFLLSRSSQVDLRRIEGLLQRAEFEPARKFGRRELPGALLGGSYLALPAPTCHCSLELAAGSHWGTQLAEQRPLFLTVPRKRGPPSQF